MLTNVDDMDYWTVRERAHQGWAPISHHSHPLQDEIVPSPTTKQVSSSVSSLSKTRQAQALEPNKPCIYLLSSHILNLMYHKLDIIR